MKAEREPKFYAVPITMYHRGEVIVTAHSAKKAYDLVRNSTPAQQADMMEEFIDHGVFKVTVRGMARLQR